MNLIDLKKKIKEQIIASIKNLYSIELEESKLILDYPVKDDFGDLTTNISFILASQLKKSPADISIEISNHLSNLGNSHKDIKEYISKIVSVGGYINFYLNPSIYFESLINLSEENLRLPNTSPKRINVEYGQPNTHKLLHIGHFFSYIAGESISNILEANGNIIRRVNYQSDIGPNVSKSIYEWRNKGKPIPETLIEKVKLLQLCYQDGARKYKESEEDKKNIDLITQQVYQQSPEIMDDWKNTRQWSVDYYKELEKFLEIKQEEHYWESNIWRIGMKTVEDNLGKHFFESDGAIIFKGEDYGLHNRVFITKNKTPTYEAKDLGLVKKKMEDWPYDLAIITTASEQNDYFKVVIKSIEEVYPDLKNKIKHIGFGMISLREGKMSSREGNILSVTDLIDNILKKVEEIINVRENLSEQERIDITKKIALGAIKYAFLKSDILKDSKFDIESSISFEGNSGPYLQYAYVRMNSILKDNKDKDNVRYDADTLSKLLNTDEEIGLIKHLDKYIEIIQIAGVNMAPHMISEYLYNLAQLFSTFYAKHSINSAENDNVIFARRFLTTKTQLILKNGLSLLGIDVVEKM